MTWFGKLIEYHDSTMVQKLHFAFYYSQAGFYYPVVVNQSGRHMPHSLSRGQLFLRSPAAEG